MTVTVRDSFKMSSHQSIKKTTTIKNVWICLLFALVAASSYPSAAIASSSTSSSSSSTIRKVVVVGGTHGNEYTGVWCIKAIDAHRLEHVYRHKYPSLDISTLLANPQAHFENKRFVHSDLNREFSMEKLQDIETGEEGLPNTIESLRAREVDMILGPKFGESDQYGTDLVIDLHSTTSNMGITVIIPEGDPTMAQAAAYVLLECPGSRCLMHSMPDKKHRPNLSSAAKHGFTIEVGPVPQSVVHHDAVEKTERALEALLDFLEMRNTKEGNKRITKLLQKNYPDGRVPCFRSAPAKVKGEMSGKVIWPCDPDNPNFPSVMVHPSLQDKDFTQIRTGDPMFVNLDGSVVNYEGSHGDEVYLIFVNEAGYYYQSSGRGIGVAVASQFSLDDGMIVDGTASFCAKKD